MSSSIPPPSTQQDPSSSFTKMEMADHDLEAIGRNCQYEFCRQLDFLPFRCESCRGTFCLEHRTETAHNCSHAGEWARRRRDNNTGGSNTANGTATRTEKHTVYNTDQCAHLTCKTLINTAKSPAVHCDKCNRQYCLQHRLREEHDCAKVVAAAAAARSSGPTPNETIRSMFSKVRTWGSKQQTSSSGRTTAVSTISQLNDLKRTAKGDTSIPSDRRIFLHVVGTTDNPNAREPPSGKFFFDSRWKVGRVLDDAARRLNVENVNNRVGGEEARLRIFHVESGQFLEFSDTIGEKVKSGHTIVLLRGAGVLLQK
ncbi:hypothetical protein VTN77DRAFT_9338 [Rasamsonia byssochlamydoides]|uniref:uncharacterized protein n=1 Tax=Rasamsonia byssochlamydoides TaxID=89139 RepID=UPI003743A37E